MSSQTLYLARKKRLIGFFVLASVAILFLVIPDLVGIEIALPLRLTSLSLMAVYVILSFEIVHRTTIAMVGATFVILIGITTGLFEACMSLEVELHHSDFSYEQNENIKYFKILNKWNN